MSQASAQSRVPGHGSVSPRLTIRGTARGPGERCSDPCRHLTDAAPYDLCPEVAAPGRWVTDNFADTFRRGAASAAWITPRQRWCGPTAPSPHRTRSHIERSTDQGRAHTGWPSGFHAPVQLSTLVADGYGQSGEVGRLSDQNCLDRVALQSDVISSPCTGCSAFSSGRDWSQRSGVHRHADRNTNKPAHKRYSRTYA